MKKYLRLFTIVIFTLAILCLICSCKNKETSSTDNSNIQETKQGDLLQKMTNNQIKAIPNSVIWGKKSFDNVTLKLNYTSEIRPTELTIGLNHPNGIRILALFPGCGVNLPLKYEKDFGGINEYGDLNKGYYIQIAEHDFDNDGAPEIIIAVGDGLTDLAVNIVKYHAPQSSKDAGSDKNWSLVGSFTGQEKAIIEEDSISLPYGSQGLFTKYKLAKNKFIKTK